MLESNTRSEGGQGTQLRPGLVDSHVHLDMYPDEAIGPILERARQRGVTLALTVSVDERSSNRNLYIAQSYPGLVAAVGLHPLRVNEEHGDSQYTSLENLASHPKVVAIGETGLDFVDPSYSRVLQEYWLRRQVRLSASTELPLVIHCRSAMDELLRIIDEEGGLPHGAVVHYFVGGREEAGAYLDRGFLISVGRPVSRPNMQTLAAAVRSIPMDRLLIETDSYPLPGRTTEPADVVEVAEAVARVKGVSWQDVADATAANFLRLFRKAQ
jgi:TatD DNase family protein